MFIFGVPRPTKVKISKKNFLKISAVKIGFWKSYWKTPKILIGTNFIEKTCNLDIVSIGFWGSETPPKNFLPSFFHDVKDN